jgi:hypothetical protein
MKDPNIESLRNLRENLAEIGVSLEATPRVFQYNKRDLADILTLDELNDALNPDRSTEWYEASATNGTGVFETLKAISKLTLRSLKGRMAAEQRRPAVVASASTPAPQPMMSSKHTASGIGAATFPQGDDGGSEVSFAEILPPPNEAPLDSSTSMKHVRVRSNVDILSELEKLRKIATQRPAAPGGSHKSKSAADVSLDDLLESARNHRKDVAQSFDLQVPRDTLAKTRHVTVGLSFGDGAGAALGSEKRFDVDFAGLKDINKLLLSLKFHVKGE